MIIIYIYFQSKQGSCSEGRLVESEQLHHQVISYLLVGFALHKAVAKVIYFRAALCLAMLADIIICPVKSFLSG